MSEMEKALGDGSVVERVAARARAGMKGTIAQLAGYLKVPAISSEPRHAADVTRLCKQVVTDLRDMGFDATMRELEGALPLVAASLRAARDDAPTLLIYGHLDIQPVEGERWTTDPHVATRKTVDDGERLYARGAADDAGGWMSHMAALGAWLEEAGELPLHVKLIIEGEEEIGSPNLERYMDAFAPDFDADVMVLTDCENPAVDMPGLTTSLRGLLEMSVRVDALESDVHSGLWGNMAPDAGNALVHLLARLTDVQGRPTFCRQQVPDAFKESAGRLPLTREVIREGAQLVDGVEPLALSSGETAAEWMWRQPALTILSTTLPRPDAHKNALRASATATLSIRIPPGLTREVIAAEVRELLSGEAPAGVKVTVTEAEGSAQSWLYEPEGPAFAATERAYGKAFERPLTQVGLGGSIPFVALFGRRFGHLPLILNGVMDPRTGAHGPDESLHLGLFEKAIVASVHLYDELSHLTPATSK